MGVVDKWVGVADSAMGCGRSTSIDSMLIFLDGSLLDEETWPTEEEVWPEDATFLLLVLG